MSNWIYGKDLIVYWDIKGFELFNYLKEGLQPYTQFGKKIIDTDTLELGREQSLEQCLAQVRQTKDTQEIVSVGVTRNGHFYPSTDKQLLQQAKERRLMERARELYERQPLKLINPPLNRMSFTLPSNTKKALGVLLKLYLLLFKKDEASEFAEKQGLPRLDIAVGKSVAHKEKEEGLASPSPSVPEMKSECEDFVRSLRCYFENKSEVKIEQPGKKPKIFNHESLGFDRVITDEWKSFIRVIEGPEHFYKYGPSKEGHQRIKAYDRNRQRLTQINSKLIGFLKKEYDLEAPKGFKTFEKVPEEDSGVYRFKFQIGKKVEKSKYQGYAKQDLLNEIKRLSKEWKIASRSDDLPKQSKLSEISDSLIAATTLANEKEWITEREMSDYIDQTWTRQEEVYDPFENSPDSNSIY